MNAANKEILAAAFTAIQAGMTLLHFDNDLSTQDAMYQGAAMTSDKLGFTRDQDRLLGAHMNALINASQDNQEIYNAIFRGSRELALKVYAAA